MSLASQVVQTIENTPPNVAHAVGATGIVAGSGGAALAQYAETAKHLTVLVGLGAACVGLLGAAFYGTYWALKALSAWRAVRKGEEVK